MISAAVENKENIVRYICVQRLQCFCARKTPTPQKPNMHQPEVLQFWGCQWKLKTNFGDYVWKIKYNLDFLRLCQNAFWSLSLHISLTKIWTKIGLEKFEKLHHSQSHLRFSSYLKNLNFWIDDDQYVLCWFL